MTVKEVALFLAKILVGTLLWVFAFLICVGISVYWAWSMLEGKLPSPAQIKGCLVTSMHQVNLCPTALDFVRFEQIPKHLVDAVIVSEDGTFWSHSGFDFHEIKESLRASADGMNFVRGASTISQQLAKNMFLGPERSLLRKILEGLITVRLERYLTKREILERYLNIVQFADGVFGVRQAAQFYFQVAPQDLTLLQSVFLAMVLPSPSRWNASFFRKQLSPFARNRMNEILLRMEARGFITAEELERALAQKESLFLPTDDSKRAGYLEEPQIDEP
jgi:monofunctional biosynthetic peptidoglycan transglycosylase